MIIKKLKFTSEHPVICVSIVNNKREDIIAEAKKLVNDKIRMIEWRLDKASFAGDGEEVRKTLMELKNICSGTILLVTIRTTAEGGDFDPEKAALSYSDLLELIVESHGADIIDVEYMLLKNMPGIIQSAQNRGTRVLVSYHDFEKTPDSKKLFEILDAMEHTGADIVKTSCMPKAEDDVLRMLSVTTEYQNKYPDKPLITVSMGNLGVISRISGEIFGSCVTFAAGDETSAPGQIPYKDLKRMLAMIHKYSGSRPAAGLKKITSSSKNKLYITGYMATGKSTVGKIISRKTGLKLIDMDQLLVKKLRMPISDYFDKYGEEAFRTKETEVLRTIAAGETAIVSCGGGVPLREENIKIIKESGTCVVLTAGAEDIFKRVYGRTDRPLLRNVKSPGDIRRLMEARSEAYKAVGDLFVNTGYNSPGKTADLIISNLNH